jgi:hypothetical protein
MVDYLDNCPYSAAALTIRRELEPSTLNGDAHHSLSGRVELRILAVVDYQTPERRKA